MVKRAINYLSVIAVILAGSVNAQPSQPALPEQAWVIYQPQQRDMSLTATQWQRLLHRLKQQGAQGLVVQWSAYGSAQFQASPNTIALTEVVDIAAAQGLKIILGLYADPDYFNHIKQPASALGFYYNKLRSLSLQQALRWQHIWQHPAFAGWYITEEIDDYHWQTQAKRQPLFDHLSQTQAALNKLTPAQPVYLSVYIGGHDTPANVTDFFQQVQQQSQMQLWLQDGEGTQALTPTQRQQYLGALMTCQPNQPTGLIQEVFRQQTPSQSNAAFSALPVNPTQWQQQQTTNAPYCIKQHLVFSLRYLPLAKGYLAH